jgi:hypothetical protein
MPAFTVLARKSGPEPTAPPASTDGTDVSAPTGTDRRELTEPTLGTDGTDVSAPTAPTPGTGLVPVLAETARASARVRFTRWARGRMADAADYQRRHRTFWHAVTVFIARPPETWAETEEHLRSRKWLQEWMTGKFRVFCEWENVAWGHLVSMPAKAVLQNIEKVFFERQAGFWLGLAGVLAGFLAWYLSHLGH